MIVRILMSIGLLALGYYVGREIGRTESIRKELENARKARMVSETDTTEQKSQPPTPAGESKN